MLPYSLPKRSFPLALMPAWNGGKKTKSLGSVTANARLAQAAHAKIARAVRAAVTNGKGRFSGFILVSAMPHARFTSRMSAFSPRCEQGMFHNRAAAVFPSPLGFRGERPG